MPRNAAPVSRNVDPSEGTGTFATCDRFAVYVAPTGHSARIPLPPGVAPRKLVSMHGVARCLVAVIAAADPRTDEEVIRDQMLAEEPELLALAKDAAA